MDYDRDNSPQPQRDLASTWGIAVLVILVMFGVSVFRSVALDPGEGDVYVASEDEGVPRQLPRPEFELDLDP